MAERYSASREEIRRAKWPHEIFLINLVFNYILVFASTFGVFSTFPLMVLVVPVTSIAITGYILVKARQVAAGNETVFVKAHWVVADRRNKQFIWLLAIACLVLGGGYWLSGMMAWSKVATIALLAGVGLLPVMVSLLVLIVLGNDSMYQARHSKLPKGYAAVVSEGATASADR